VGARAGGWCCRRRWGRCRPGDRGYGSVAAEFDRRAGGKGTIAPPFPTIPDRARPYKYDAGLILREHDPVTEVPLSALTATQNYAHRDKVVDSAEAAARKGHMRPITVVRHGGKLYIDDGHHRATATALAGRETVPARVYDWDAEKKGYVPATSVGETATHAAQPPEPGFDLADRGPMSFGKGNRLAAKEGKRLFGKWKKTLAADEKGAIGWYKGGGFRNINTQLRTGQSQPADPDELKKDYGIDFGTDEAIRHLDAALSRAKLPEPVVVYRGFSGPNTAARLLAVKPGHVFVDKAYGSATLNPDTAYWSFAKKGPGVVARIELPAGFQAADLTGEDAVEPEILLRRDVRFEVGRTVVKTDEHGNPYHEVTLRPIPAAGGTGPGGG
jgi:uncharacterized ParB-like nuclease family protein